MKMVLETRFADYLKSNQPDLAQVLISTNQFNVYIENEIESMNERIEQLQDERTPAYEIEAICFKELVEKYEPSRYNYIINVLFEEFPAEYTQWQESGQLVNEGVSLIDKCYEIFELFGFTEENEENRNLRYAIVGVIKQYLAGKFVDAEYLDKIDFNGEPDL